MPENHQSNVRLLIDLELTKLREEIFQLKRHQIHFIFLAIALFGAVASIVAALLPHLPIFSEEGFNPVYVLSYISITSIIPIIYPYISWVIIHKCRSIFRIVAYIRTIENIMLEKSHEIHNYFFGYERHHRKLKDHPWLKIRIVPFHKFLKRLDNDFQTYKERTEKAIRAYEKWKNTVKDKYKVTENISYDGLRKKVEVPYIGDYYGKILFFVNLLGIIGVIAVVILSIYAYYYTGGFYHYFFLLIAISSILWYVYHFRLLKRYLMELRYQPFSIDAHYDMWQWAIQRLQKND